MWRSTSVRVLFWARSVVIVLLAGGAVALVGIAIVAAVWAKRGEDVPGRVVAKHIDRAGGSGLAGPATVFSIDYQTMIDGVERSANGVIDARMFAALVDGPGTIQHVRVRALRVGPWVYQDLRPADSQLWTKARNAGLSALLGLFVVSVLIWRHFVRHRRLVRLFRIGEVAEGRITSIMRGRRRRQSIEYSFSVGVESVEGRVSTGKSGVEGLQEGSRVNVFFDGKERTRSALYESSPFSIPS